MVTARAGAIVDERYEILGVIGAGGFGTVYKARQVHLDRIVALKVLNEASNDETWARFEREGKILSSLQNKHITYFHSFGHWAGAPYMVTEFVEGQDLQKLLFSNKPLGVPRSLAILMQICDGVGAAHTAGVIHRDLKPSNVLLSADDSVKVIDFGLAKLVAGSAGQKLTEAGCAIGSVLYMSPEQCIGQPADERSDIYALGAILYHCLTGRTVFDGDHSVVVMQKHVGEPPPRLRESGIEFERMADLQAVLDKCLAKQAEYRYQSVADLLMDLQLLQLHQPPSALNQPVPVQPVDKRKANEVTIRVRRHVLPAVIILFALIIVAGGSVYFASSDSKFLTSLASYCESHNQNGSAEALRRHIFEDLSDAGTVAWVNAGIALVRTEKANGNSGDAKAAFEKVQDFLLPGSKRNAQAAEWLILLRQAYRPENDPSISEAWYQYANLLADSGNDIDASKAFEKYLDVVRLSLERNRRDEIIATCRLIIILKRTHESIPDRLFDSVLDSCATELTLDEIALDWVQSAFSYVETHRSSDEFISKWLNIAPDVYQRCHIAADTRTRYEIQMRGVYSYVLGNYEKSQLAKRELERVRHLCEVNRTLRSGQYAHLRQHLERMLALYAKRAPNESDTEQFLETFVNSTDPAMQICGLRGMASLRTRQKAVKDAESYQALARELSIKLDRNMQPAVNPQSRKRT